MTVATLKVLGDVIVAPRDAWDQVNQRGQWIWPLVLLAIATVTAWSVYYSKVDIAWLQDHLLAGTSELQGRELALAREVMGPGLLALMTIVSSLIVGAMIMLLTAGYLHMMARMLCVTHAGPSWLVFAAWLTVPEACALLLMAVRLAFGSNQQILPELASPLALSQLLDITADSPWLSLAGAVGLQSFWTLALSTIGVSRWMKIDTGRAALIASLPPLLIYGIWALLIAMDAGA